MTPANSFSRRSFLAITAAAPILSAAAKSKLPVGLELYSVRNQLKQDEMGTVKSVAKMGYQGVEFYSPYYNWTPEYTKDMRKLLDDLGIKCFSTHNGPNAFAPDNYSKTIDLNQTMGSKFVVMASGGRVNGMDGWKTIGETLTNAAEKFKQPVDGKRPIEVIAANSSKDVMLQLDVGTCIEAGSDPIAWIKANPGRINCLHCKDWSPEADKGYKVLFGEGVAPWKKIFDTAEKVGGAEYYLIEQEGSRFPELETAEKCLAEFKKIYS